MEARVLEQTHHGSFKLRIRREGRGKDPDLVFALSTALASTTSMTKHANTTQEGSITCGRLPMSHLSGSHRRRTAFVPGVSSVLQINSFPLRLILKLEIGWD